MATNVKKGDVVLYTIEEMNEQNEPVLNDYAAMVTGVHGFGDSADLTIFLADGQLDSVSQAPVAEEPEQDHWRFRS